MSDGVRVCTVLGRRDTVGSTCMGEAMRTFFFWGGGERVL